MSSYPIPEDEAARLIFLRALDPFPDEADPALDLLVALAKSVAQTPIAVLSLVEAERQRFKSCLGLEVDGTDRDVAFCSHAILSDEVLWVEDATLDPRFRSNPLVTGEPHIRFYAGAPVIVDRRRLGTICVIDRAPRPFSETLRDQLARLASLASTHMLNQSRNRTLLDVLRCTPDAVVCADPIGSITFWNPAAERMLGYAANEILGRPLATIIPDRLRSAHADGFPRTIGVEGRRPPSMLELPVLHRDGCEVTVEASIATSKSGGGFGAAAIMRDCSERRAVQEDLRRTQALLSATLESVPASIMMKDVATRRLILVNRATEQLTGMPRDELLGRRDHDLLPKAQADLFSASDEEVLASGGVKIIPEEEIQTPNRGVRLLQTKKLAIPDASGVPAFILAISEDITERRADERALASAREEAEAASRIKSEFLANMSHEIRTPLNGVRGVLDVLARTDLDPRQIELVEIAGRSAAGLERLLSDILDLSRVESGQIDVRAEPFELVDVIDDVCALLALKAREKALRFVVEMAPEARLRVVGDDLRLKQILINLLNNAVKFTDAGEVRLGVTVEAASPRPVVTFSVTDTGVGFGREAQAVVFERFRQVDGSLTRKHGGSGLGLAISRELARIMGGEIEASSRPGVGSIFTLRLPFTCAVATHAKSGPLSGAADLAIPTARADATALRVLLAEDNATNRRVVELIAGASGADIVSVVNGAEAVVRAREQAFDLILMDMQMPVMDGLCAIRLIRTEEARAGRRTPIHVLSANAMAVHVEASLAAGADGHLAKPITAATLLTLMSDVATRARDAEGVASQAA